MQQCSWQRPVGCEERSFNSAQQCERDSSSHALRHSWPVPDVHLTQHSERAGREQNWFSLRGRVVAVKVEADGDLHNWLLKFWIADRALHIWDEIVPRRILSLFGFAILSALILSTRY